MPKLESFDGKPNEWDSFIFHFRKIAHYHQGSKSQKRDRLLTCLRGKAVTFIQGKSKKTYSTYCSLWDTLDARFGHLELPSTARRHLATIKQEKAESLEDWSMIVSWSRHRRHIQTFRMKLFSRLQQKASWEVARIEQQPMQHQKRTRTQSTMRFQMCGSLWPTCVFSGDRQFLCAKLLLWIRSQDQVNHRSVCPLGWQKNNKPSSSCCRTHYLRVRCLPASSRDYSPASSPRNRSRSPSPGRGRYNCGQPGYFARECPQPQKCFICSGKGHTSADYPVGACDRATSPTRKSESGSESWLGESVRQFVFQDSGGDTMLVPVKINGTRISAIVDTAAQVTVMNPKTRQTLGFKESSLSEVVQLRNAQKESVMSGRLWKHVGLRLGGRKYYLDIVEADINDSFILGMDFLQQHHCKIDLGQNVLEMGDGEKIHATMRGRKKTGCYNVSRVTLEKKAKIPPSSIKICQAKMNNPADVPFLLEGEIHDDVYVLPLLIQGSDFVNVCVVNLSDVPGCLRRHTLLAKAVEVDAMLDPHGAESGDGAQGPVVYVCGEDFDGHIDAELPSICRVESTEDGPEVQFFSAESRDGSLDTVDVKVGPSRDSVSSDGSSLEGTCWHVTAGLPTQKGAEGRSSLSEEANDTDQEIASSSAVYVWWCCHKIVRGTGCKTSWVTSFFCWCFCYTWPRHWGVYHIGPLDQDWNGVSHSSTDETDSIRIWRRGEETLGGHVGSQGNRTKCFGVGFVTGAREKAR